jgi:hypothetical protein
MQKKIKRSVLVKKLDTIFSTYIRLKMSDKNGISTCITCGKKEEWKNQDCGHFISRTHYSTRWDENNVATQCRYCNRYCQGEQYKYSLYLGNNLSEELYIKSKQIVKFADVELIDMIKYYKEKVNVLLKFS